MFLKSLAVSMKIGFTAGLAALALSACSPQGASGPVTAMDGDSFIGGADAKVTIIEYGAPTCGACKSWHAANWAQLKTAFIDTNKIKFVFREFPSHNPPVDAAIFAMARCAGQAKYFPLIDEAFARQEDIEKASQQGKAQDALNSLGSKFGLGAGQVKACISDKKNIDRIFAVRGMGEAAGVTGTPTFFINDRLVQDPSFGSMKSQIEAILGEGAPAAPAPAAETPAPAPAPAQQ
jgi:protein-disulfide isomerase